MSCIVGARAALRGRIAAEGDGQISNWRDAWKYVTPKIFFSLESAFEVPDEIHVKYSTAIEVLRAYALKMNREGFRQRYGVILVTKTGQEVGDTLMSRDFEPEERRRKIFP